MEQAVADGLGFAHFLSRAAEAADARERYGAQGLAVANSMAEYLTRKLHNEVDQEAARVEYGLTVLASAGSAAPYVGLFGTVWGI